MDVLIQTDTCHFTKLREICASILFYNFAGYNLSYNNGVMIIWTFAQERLEVGRRGGEDDSVSPNGVVFVAGESDVAKVRLVSHLLEVLNDAVFKLFHLEDVKVTCVNAGTPHS